MREIRCPDSLRGVPASCSSLFVAGSIGGDSVVDWQGPFINGLSDLTDLLAFNPRRANFPVGSAGVLEEQIDWEFEALRRSQAISFWLAADYASPITVFELGVWSTSAKPIFVGIDTKFPLKVSLTAQLMLSRPNLVIVDSLEALSLQVKKWHHVTGEFSLPEQPMMYDQFQLYLAGGITGCPDWQADIQCLIDHERVEVIDPRNRTLDRDGLSEAALTTLSNKNHTTLMGSGAFCVWYPKEAKSPTSLFELGMLAAAHSRPLFVGAEDGYFRKSEVLLQLRHFRPDICVVDSVEALAGQVNAYFAQAV